MNTEQITSLPHDVLIPRREMREILGIGHTTSFRWQRDDPRFPKPIQLSAKKGGAVRFKLSEVLQFGQLIGCIDATEVGGAP